MKKSILAAAILAAVSSTSAWAGGSLFGSSSNESSAGAIYGGASVGMSSDSTCNSVVDQASGSLVKDFDCPTPTGWKVFGGYKVAPNLAIEGSYIDFGEGEADGSIPVIPGVNTAPNATALTTNATGFGVSGVASAPVNDQVSLFGKVGFLAWERETVATVGNVGVTNSTVKQTADTDGVDLSLGAGAEYKINENWGVRGEVEHFEGVNANLYSVGATFSTF